MKPGQFAKKAIRKIIASGKAVVDEGKYQKIAENYDLRGYKRIYLVHIRKTGGTSLNNAFLSLSGENSRRVYAQLSRSPDHRVSINGLVYAGWNVKHINNGHYFYAFSHTPFDQLSLPDKTFTVSCFRDPVKRVVSHYNELMHFYVNKIDHPCMATEGKWLGNSFDDFLSKVPKEHLLNQLYMFSSNLDVNQAISNVQKLSHIFYIDDFDKGVSELNEKTGLKLEPMYIRKGSYQDPLPNDSLASLRDMLQDEYRFLDGICESQHV